MREHALRKAKHHLKELEEKYHHLKKDYDALLHMQAKFMHLEEELVVWKEKYAHMETECHMWEEKFHKCEAKYHEVYGKYSTCLKTIEELKISNGLHDGVIAEWELKCKALTDRCHHLDEEMH